jgi:hypothetical protein
MESPADRRIGAILCEVVSDHQKAAGLERGKQLAVHLGAIDVEVSRVVIEEQVGDHIEIMHVCRQWIIVGSHDGDAIFHCGLGGPRLERIPRTNDPRHQLGAVTATGPHIEHLHARSQPSDDRVALLLTLCDEHGNEIDSDTAPSGEAAIRSAIMLLSRTKTLRPGYRLTVSMQSDR